jgi:alpha-L-fucosidase
VECDLSGLDLSGKDLEGADLERYIAYMKNQLKELVQNYGDIGVLWFDGE